MDRRYKKIELTHYPLIGEMGEGRCGALHSRAQAKKRGQLSHISVRNELISSKRLAKQCASISSDDTIADELLDFMPLRLMVAVTCSLE
jgi:hypothetical protein